MKSSTFLRFGLGLLLTTATTASLGCGAEAEPDDSEAGCDGGKCDDVTDEQSDRNVCVALRGNGERIFGILAGIARVTEEYGPLWGAAGGSSGSISAFLTESVHANPVITTCGDATCSNEEAGLRAALLIKSMQGYFEVLADSEEVHAFNALAPLAGTLRDANLEELAETDIAAAQAALTEILESEDLRDLINPEVLETIRNSPDPAFHVRDFIDTVSAFGSFSTDDASIVIRPGFVDFGAIAEKTGRIGSFYAGYEPVDTYAMAAFVDGCAPGSRGLNWAGVAALEVDGTTCGTMFKELATNFRDQLTADEDKYRSRIDDPVGGDFHALVPTSVLTGDAATAWTRARESYAAAEDWSLDVDFDDVKFGFFGTAEDLERMTKNSQGYTDAKTEKVIGLGPTTWREALTYSPAEPGIARGLELPDGNISAGGWPDLHPILALKNIGCDEVVYISRAGVESTFATGMAGLFNASESDIAGLYDPQRPDSGFGLSLSEADATLCTDWNDIDGLDLATITDNAYNAPLETDDAFFVERERAYAGLLPRAQGRVGCSVEAK